MSPNPSRRDHNGDVTAGTVRRGVVLVVLGLSACTAASNPDTGDLATPTTITAGSTAAPETTTTEAASPTQSATTEAETPLPRNAQDYAMAALEAWMAGDQVMLARLVNDAARQRLDEGSLDPAADWVFQACEGAAGSTFCTWEGPDGTLTFRVANEAAGLGKDGAVVETLIAGG